MPDTEVRPRELTRATLPPPVPVSPACANCGTPLAGPYCANCGQHVADFHRSVWRFVADFLDNTICWDNKLLRTLEPLFKQPGFLTHEFMAGRRVRYVHPLRLFLFTSAVCLTLLKYGHSGHHAEASAHKVRQPKQETPVQVEGPISPPPSARPGADAATADPSPPAAATNGDANRKADVSAAADADDDDDTLGKAIRQAVAEKVGPANKPGEAGINAAAEKMKQASSRIEQASDRMTRAADGLNDAGGGERLSWVALALLPVFAFGLRALYRTTERFYFEHLIFSLHYHVFLLLFWTVYVGILGVASHLPLHGLFELVVRSGLVLPPIYLFVALRRIYGEGTKRTVFKTLFLGGMHLLTIVIGAEAVGAAAILSGSK